RNGYERAVRLPRSAGSEGGGRRPIQRRADADGASRDAEPSLSEPFAAGASKPGGVYQRRRTLHAACAESSVAMPLHLGGAGGDQKPSGGVRQTGEHRRGSATGE